jgi:hypothetical protein
MYLGVWLQTGYGLAELDLLTTYVQHSELQFTEITDTKRLVSSVYYSFQ